MYSIHIHVQKYFPSRKQYPHKKHAAWIEMCQYNFLH